MGPQAFSPSELRPVRVLTRTERAYRMGDRSPRCRYHCVHIIFYIIVFILYYISLYLYCIINHSYHIHVFTYQIFVSYYRYHYIHITFHRYPHWRASLAHRRRLGPRGVLAMRSSRSCRNACGSTASRAVEQLCCIESESAHRRSLGPRARRGTGREDAGTGTRARGRANMRTRVYTHARTHAHTRARAHTHTHTHTGPGGP